MQASSLNLRPTASLVEFTLVQVSVPPVDWNCAGICLKLPHPGYQPLRKTSLRISWQIVGHLADTSTASGKPQEFPW